MRLDLFEIFQSLSYEKPGFEVGQSSQNKL